MVVIVCSDLQLQCLCPAYTVYWPAVSLRWSCAVSLLIDLIKCNVEVTYNNLHRVNNDLARVISRKTCPSHLKNNLAGVMSRMTLPGSYTKVEDMLMHCRSVIQVTLLTCKLTCVFTCRPLFAISVFFVHIALNDFCRWRVVLISCRCSCVAYSEAAVTYRSGCHNI